MSIIKWSSTNTDQLTNIEVDNSIDFLRIEINGTSNSSGIHLRNPNGMNYIYTYTTNSLLNISSIVFSTKLYHACKLKTIFKICLHKRSSRHLTYKAFWYLKDIFWYYIPLFVNMIGSLVDLGSRDIIVQNADFLTIFSIKVCCWSSKTSFV